MMQLQALEREAGAEMFSVPRIIINPSAPLKTQGLEVATESQSSKPPGVHPVVSDGELLQHRAAPSHSCDAIIAALAAHKLQLDQPFAAMGEDGEADVGDPTVFAGAVQRGRRGNDAEDLEVRKGRDRPESEVGASVELELLQRRTAAGDIHQATGLGRSRG